MEKKKSDILIERKNEYLSLANTELKKVGDIAEMLRDVHFDSTKAADTFMLTLSDTLRRISYERYDIATEAHIALPEAEQEPTIDQTEEVTADDLPFC